MPSESKAVAEFLNVDLDIELPDGLDELLEHFTKSMFVLHREKTWARLELDASASLILDATLAKMASAIEELPPEAKALWDKCTIHKLDIGLRAGDSFATFEITRETVAKLQNAQVELGLTIYAPEGPDNKDGDSTGR